MTLLCRRSIEEPAIRIKQATETTIMGRINRRIAPPALTPMTKLGMFMESAVLGLEFPLQSVKNNHGALLSS